MVTHDIQVALGAEGHKSRTRDTLDRIRPCLRRPNGVVIQDKKSCTLDERAQLVSVVIAGDGSAILTANEKSAVADAEFVRSEIVDWSQAAAILTSKLRFDDNRQLYISFD